MAAHVHAQPQRERALPALPIAAIHAKHHRSAHGEGQRPPFANAANLPAGGAAQVVGTGSVQDKVAQLEKKPPPSPPLPRQNTKTQPPSPPKVIRDSVHAETYERVGFLGEVCGSVLTSVSVDFNIGRCRAALLACMRSWTLGTYDRRSRSSRKTLSRPKRRKRRCAGSCITQRFILCSAPV